MSNMSRQNDRIEDTISPDDLALEKAVNKYFDAQQKGDPPPLEDFLTKHPKIADRLRACLSGLDAANAAAQAMASSPSARPVPAKIADFEILGKLGQGGMGEVYRAQQVSLNRPVALKLLPPYWCWTPKARWRFHREAQAAAKLHHTNIVAVYAEGEEQGICYYAMELIDGPSLDQVIQELRADECSVTQSQKAGAKANSPQTESHGSDSSGLGKSSRERFDTIATWIASLADALGYAHEEGVVHRDVKPSNVMLGKDGRVRLTDFGLARLANEPGMTVTGEVLGTPRYMSPEQVLADGTQVDGRADIYSLGATLYELLTLQAPFIGETRDQIISQLLNKEPKSPRQINPSIPLDLETICLKALEKEPQRRYQNADDFAADLRRYVDRYAITAKRASAVDRLVKWARRQPAVAALSVCLLIAAISMTVLGWQTYRNEARMKAERRQNAVDRALTEVMTGDHKKAAEAVREAELLGAEAGWVRLLEGQVSLARGDLNEAQQHFEQAIRLMPESVAAHALLGRSYVYLGSYESGLQIQAKIEELTPNTLQDRLFLGYYQSVYTPADSVRTIDRVIAERDSSVARMIRASALSNLAHLHGDPQAAERATVDAAAAYAMLSKNNQLALALCIEAHNAAINAYTMTNDQPRRQQHIRRAGEYVDRVDHEQAIDQVLCHVAYHWDRKGDGEQALDAWERAANTGWMRCVKVYVCELFRRGQFQQALDVIDSAGERARNTNLDPLRALMLAELHQPDAALEELRRLENQRTMKVEIKVYVATIAHLLGCDELAGRIVRNAEIPESSYIPHDVIHYHAGRKTADEILATAAPGLSAGEVRFHIAHHQLGRLGPNDREEATANLSAKESLNTYYHYEYRWSRAFRERLESDPDWPASIQIHE